MSDQKLRGDQITMEAVQDLARAGKVRWRAFGETKIYGYSMHHGGDLDFAADDLPRVLSTGLCKLYQDEDGIFIGPLNPKYVEDDVELLDDEPSNFGGCLQ